MAFYFALLNVSSKREDRSTERSSSHRRRRHSIASVESPLLDYRLLPRPQVVGQNVLEQDHLMEQACSSLSMTKTQRRQQRNERERLDRNERAERNERHERSERGMKKSESSYNTGRAGGGKKHDRSVSSDVRNNCEVWKNGSAQSTSRDPPNPHTRHTVRSDRHPERRPLEIHPEIVITLKDDLTPTDKPSCLMTSPRHPNDPAASSPEREERVQRTERAETETHEEQRAQTSRGRGRGRGGRPLVVKRRVSPPDSTTSGSRRSSKGSQNSLARRDSPSSSVSSRRESEEPRQSPSFSLLHASLKLSGITVTPKAIEKTSNLKKVTFDTQHSPYVIANSFLGDGAVRRASGCAALLRAASAANHHAECSSSAGASWWPSCAAEAPDEGRHQNDTNHAIDGGRYVHNLIGTQYIEKNHNMKRAIV